MINSTIKGKVSKTILRERINFCVNINIILRFSSVIIYLTCFIASNSFVLLLLILPIYTFDGKLNIVDTTDTTNTFLSIIYDTYYSTNIVITSHK